MAVPNARSLIVDLTPPVLLRVIQKVWRRMRGIGFHTFEGNFPSLADVPCGKDSYDDDELAQLIAGARLENLKSAGATKKITDSTGHLILPLVVSQLFAAPLTVLDFGGGAGVGLVSILDHVPNLDLSKFSYVVVETPAMCRAVRDKIEPILKEKYGTSSFVEIVEDIPTSFADPLIVNMGSAIQYISSYRETLSRLANLWPKYFIVSQTPMTEGPTYARQQLNMPHKKLASWVFNRADFISEMKTLGYRITFMVDHDLPLTHKNAPGSSSMVSMVFRPYSN